VRLRPRQFAAVATVGVVLVAGGTVAASRSHSTESVLVQAGGTTTTAQALPPPTVAFFGDSLAATLEASAKSWGDRTGKIKVVDGVTSSTCGIDRDQIVLDSSGASVPIPSLCSNWDSQWASAATASKPDIAVIVTGIRELDDHRAPSDPNFTGPGNQGYDYQLYLLMHKAIDALAASGTKVIWLNLPSFADGSGPPSDPGRVAAFNKLLTQLAQNSPNEVQIADLATWIKNNGGPAAEPSQTGFPASVADHIVMDYLAGQIQQVWSAARSGTTSTSSSTTSTALSGSTLTIPPPPAGVVVNPTKGTSSTEHSHNSTGTTRTTKVPKADRTTGSTRTTVGG
jgi:hypothetical protein